MADIVLLAALKVFPLSDRILIGIPLHAVNLLKLCKISLHYRAASFLL